MIIKAGATDQSLYFILLSASTGDPVTGLTIANLDATYTRTRAAAVKNDLTALGAANSAHADNQAIEVDATNAPGQYRVDFPDAAFASGAKTVILCINGAAIKPAHKEIDLEAVDTITDAVWDETLTGSSHNVASSAGRRLREISGGIITSGTAQAGATASITLASAASSTDGTYDPAIVRIVAGTGIGQARLIIQYVGSTRVASVDRDWRVTPDNTSEYEIVASQNLISTNEGLAQGGASTSITLNASASATNDVYVGQTVVLRTGTGQDQSRIITAYNGTTKVATVATAWQTNPAAGTGYILWPLGRARVTSMEPDVVNASALATDAVTEIQSGLATQTSVDAIADVTQQLDLMIDESAGSPGEYEFTAHALQNAPTGGGTAPTASEIADEVQTRTIAAVTTVNGLAANTVTAAALAADAVAEIQSGLATSAEVGAVPTAIENADALLNRDMSAVSDTESRSPLNALRFIRNKWSISGTTLTVTKEDDTASAWTATVTATPGADPITGNDPA
jgi:hypothetical protein